MSEIVIPKTGHPIKLIAAGAIGCAVVFLLIVAIGALVFLRQTIPGVAVKPTSSPTAASFTRGTATPTAPVARSVATPTALAPTPTRPTEWLIYVATNAPVSIQYPKDWTVTDLERANSQIIFAAPDRSARANVLYGPAGSQTAEQALDAFITGTLKPQAADLKILSQKKNADASVTAEVEYTSADLGGPARSLIRALIHPGANAYTVMFTALTPRYDGYKDMAQTFVESLSIGK
jgi:hypothetical protein